MVVGAKLKPVAVKISDRVSSLGRRKEEEGCLGRKTGLEGGSEEARRIENGNRGVLVGRRVSLY